MARKRLKISARGKARSKRQKPPPPKKAPVAPPPKRQEVTVVAAKGRPMLTWVGKRPLRNVVVFPAQHVETFDPIGDSAKRAGAIWDDWPERYPRGGLLFHGDNKEVLAHLLANGFRGKVNLIYIDPPFDSGADYVRKVTLRGPKGTAKLGGEGYTLGEQLQYTDIWANDNYLQFMYERLLLMRELLAGNGSIWLHCDNRKNYFLRMLMDEAFGADAIVNEIIWRSTTFTGSSKAIAGRFPTNHNSIFWYHKGERFTFNKVREQYKEEYLQRFANPDNDPNGPWQSVSLKTYSQETFDRLKSENRLISPQRPGAGWRFKFYLKDAKGKVVETLWLDREASPTAEEKKGYAAEGEQLVPSIWLDINMANAMADERTGYPTEKPDDLLERIIEASSDPGDLVLDCFIGSGTTAAVAQRLGRRWIGCDINKGAIQTTSKRLQTIIHEQIEGAGKPRQAALEGVASGESAPEPAQLSFTVWRVNAYDLPIHHEEAVALACEHIGVERIRTDRYYNGTLGKKLLKVVPFNHPLTPLDLEELKQELDARPGEDRTVVLVSLGKDPATDAWIEDWNQLRKGRAAVNRIEVIELRTDPKYGKFFQHQPARAKVRASRKNDRVVVEIEDFISPTIIERLQEQAGLLKPKIEDWRAMVDSVLIDPDYDGKVFRIGLSDVPERKTDLVAGRYEIPAGKAKGTIAVKVTDMLGEEVLVALPKP